MKTYSIFFQGYNSYGILEFDTIKYKTVVFDAAFLISHIEKKFKLKNVQINHYIEVITKKPEKKV